MGASAATLLPGTVFREVVEVGKAQGAWKTKWFFSGALAYSLRARRINPRAERAIPAPAWGERSSSMGRHLFLKVQATATSA